MGMSRKGYDWRRAQARGRTSVELGPRTVLFGSENKTTKSKLARTKMWGLECYHGIISMYSELSMSMRSVHFKQL